MHNTNLLNVFPQLTRNPMQKLLIVFNITTTQIPIGNGPLQLRAVLNDNAGLLLGPGLQHRKRTKYYEI